MADFLGMFDAVLNAFTVAKSAGEVDEHEEQSKTEQASDETRAKMDEIIEQREQEIKERRAEQTQITDQHRQRHKR